MPKGVPSKGFQATSTRQNILTALELHDGVIEDVDGRAVEKLRQLTGHKTTNALSGVLKQMELKGLIERYVEGRRTFRISLPGAEVTEETQEPDASEDTEQVVSLHDDTADSTDQVEQTNVQRFLSSDTTIDYETLGAVMIKMAARAIDAPPQSQLDLMNRRLLEAETRAHEAHQQMVEAQKQAAAAEDQLAQLQKNYNVLLSKLDKAKSPEGTPIRKMLRDSEVRALDQLMRQLPTTRG